MSAKFYVALDGSDAGAGSVTNPWRTIKDSVNRLGPGDTLYVRGGVYRERDILVSVAGTAGSPITIRNYPNESVTIDGSPVEFSEGRATAWQLVDPVRDIYRSSKQYDFRDYKKFVGGKYSENGKVTSLVSYSDRQPTDTTLPMIGGYLYLSSDDHNYNKNAPRYLGPGVQYGGPTGLDGHIYVRLVRNTLASMHGIDHNTPTTTDPRHLEIGIASTRWGLRPTASSKHVVFQGINLANFHYNVRGEAAHWMFRRFTTRPGLGGFVFAGDSHDLVIENVVVDGAIPPSLGWADVKAGETPANDSRLFGVSFQPGAATPHHVEIRHCTFNGLFDATIVPKGHQYSFHHNTTFNVLDDFVQLSTNTHDVEIAYNFFGRSAGPSHQGAGSTTAPGTKYVHHNVFDNRTPIMWSRFDPLNKLGQHEQGLKSAVCFPAHGGERPTDGDPWKIYQNTVLTGLSAAGFLAGNLWTNNTPPANLTGVEHASLNNIFSMSEWMYGPRAYDVTKAWEVADGNVYFRDPNSPDQQRTELFLAVITGPGMTKSFESLAEFKSSAAFTATKAHYAPGWENSSIDSDPQLSLFSHELFRPELNGPAASGGVNLSGTGLPGTADSTWRGAIPPYSPAFELGLVAYWPFNEGSGIRVRDVVGGRNATLTETPRTLPGGTTNVLPSTKWGPGLNRSAVYFTTPIGTVTVPNNFNDFDTSFTFTMWVKVVLEEHGGVLIRNAADRKGFILELSKAEPFGVPILTIADGTTMVSTKGPRIDDGLWHFVAVVMNRDPRTMRAQIVVDGQTASEHADLSGVGSIRSTAKLLELGTGLPGALDEVRLYDRPLSVEEIQSLFVIDAPTGSRQ
jgi:hypothetical protein